MKTTVIICVVVSLVMSPLCPALAKQFLVADRALNLFGSLSQTVKLGIAGDHWDTQEGFNSAITRLLLEGSYSLSRDFIFYAAGTVAGDLAYPILESNEDWERKLFDKSDNLALDNEWWQLLKEAHISWSPGDFFVRIGKQRVSWGEMDVFPVNDIINPQDYTHGLSELDLESVIIPIPLLRLDYSVPGSVGFLENLAAQFVFNPNVDFIANTSAGGPEHGAFLGNDAAGVWALDLLGPDVIVVPGIGEIDRDSAERLVELLDPTGENGLKDFVANAPTLFTTRIGRQDLVIDKPDNFDSDYFEYGLRLSATIGASLFSVMGFYGRENDPVGSFGGEFAPDSGTVQDDDGNVIWTFVDRAFFPKQKFIGVAWAGALPIRISAFGGVEPILRLEGRYQFDKVYLNQTEWFDEYLLALDINFEDNLVESDFVVGGINVEYKVKAPWQVSYFSFFFEANYNEIVHHEEGWGIGDNNWWNYYFWLETGYFRGKLRPSFEWYSEREGETSIVTLGIKYLYNTSWTFSFKTNFFESKDIKYDGNLFGNKDNVWFQIIYNWG